jgi:hypothetical protein
MNEIDAAFNQLFDEIKRGVLLQARHAASRSTSRQTFKNNLRPLLRTLSHHGGTYTGALRQALAVHFFPALSEESGPEERHEETLNAQGKPELQPSHPFAIRRGSCRCNGFPGGIHPD